MMKQTFGIEPKSFISMVILTAFSLSLVTAPAFADDPAATKSDAASGSPSSDVKAAGSTDPSAADKTSSESASSPDTPVKVQKERGKKSGTKEFLKYFNPVPEKAYLNKSQDRIIKKKRFKQVEVTGAKPIFNKETGFFAIVPYEKLGDTSYMSALLDKPGVNGLSISAPWAALEPVETEFDWKAIDNVLELVKSKNKSVILRVTTAGLDNSRKSDTPEWVLTSDVKTLKYKGSDKNEHVMPIFWDTNYLAKWNNFVAELADKYDESPQIHSIGITGGGIQGSTGVIPDFSGELKVESAETGEIEKGAYSAIEQGLVADQKMTPRLLVENWKYVSDMFPKYFSKARLNFDINPPIRGRKGQAALDEISDYLVYRYGQRIYLTRQGVKDGKHGFNEYRVLLKFHPDTLTGYQLRPDFDVKESDTMAKFAAEDGISYLEVPADLLSKDDATLQKALADLQLRMGPQFVSRQVNLPKDAKVGAPITASFDFVNLGSASAMKPSRQMDKDVATSFKVQLELRNASGKPTMRSLHTPEIPTNMWKSGEPIVWQEELKMPKLDPGKYDVFLSLVDVDTKRKLNFLNAIGQKEPELAVDAPVGSIEIK